MIQYPPPFVLEHESSANCLTESWMPAFAGMTTESSTPRAEIDRITRIMDDAKKPYELHLYEGANHAFVNDAHPDKFHKEATEAAWPRTVEFLKRHLAG